ncbi:MAG: PIN domain-containing protein [Nitriliruptorales bacterium]
MTTVLVDTHVLQWWSAEPERLSPEATEALAAAAEVAVAAISWFELSWLAAHHRIIVSIPARSWLEQLSRHVRTVGITPVIADTAVGLPDTFPGDPADRLIYATAIETGWRLITKDARLRDHPHPRPITLW